MRGQKDTRGNRCTVCNGKLDGFHHAALCLKPHVEPALGAAR